MPEPATARAGWRRSPSARSRRPACSASCRRRSRRCIPWRASARVEPMPALPERVRTPGRQLLGALWFEERTMFIDTAPVARAPPLHRGARADARALPVARGGAARGHERRAVPPGGRAARGRGQPRRGAAALPGPQLRRAASPRSARRSPRRSRSRASTGRARTRRCTTTSSRTPRALALLVVGRFPRRDGSLPVWRSVESRRYLRRFDRAAAATPAGLVPGSPLRELVEAARHMSEPAVAPLRWPGPTGACAASTPTSTTTGTRSSCCSRPRTGSRAAPAVR